MPTKDLNIENLILVIDDSNTIRNGITLVLKEGGYRVIVAKNGKEGLYFFDEIAPNLVITDIIMPEQDGMEVIRKIREKNKIVKIIAMSAGGRLSSDNYLKMAKLLGANKVINKPFKLEQMLEEVKQILPLV